LLEFANAVEGYHDDPSGARADLLAEVGPDGVLEAAGTIAIFNGLIRVADGTGIQLDDGLKAASGDERDRLGINSYVGAFNTPADDHSLDDDAGESPAIVDVQKLFS